MMLRCLAFTLLAAAATGASFGQWGIRASLLHFETVSPRGTWNLVGGLDHDLNARIAIGLEYNYAIDLFGTGMSEQGQYDGYHVDYLLERKVSGLTYHSHYFIADNDDGTAFYLGPFIGFRRIAYAADPDAYAFTNSTSPAWARRETGTSTTFPLGLRLGIRSPLDGFMGDLFVSIGTQLGDKEPIKAPYLVKRDQLGGFFLQVGYALGIGW